MRTGILIAAGVVALAACRSGPEANNQAESAPEANTVGAESETAAAERLVRSRIGSNGEASFAQPQTGTRQGVSVVCGSYRQGGREHRYIVVNRDDVFIEPEMREGQMAQAVTEFCGDGELG